MTKDDRDILTNDEWRWAQAQDERTFAQNTEHRPLTLNDYQTESARTANKHDNELANYGLGIAGEAGEVADLIKKSIFHGHNVDKAEITKELGDTLWYISQIARLAGVSLEEVAQGNLDKLRRRYPEGFSQERSINRKEDE